MISDDPLDQRLIDRELAQKVFIVMGLPYYYQVHLNKLCNQKCIMCMPNGRHPHDEMPLDNFLVFFERIRASATNLTLLGGEPLMYRWIDEVLELLSKTRIEVTIITNATALNDKVSQRLLSLHELNLRCSIDAATRPTYLKVHGTDHFDRVAAQIGRFSVRARVKANIRLILHYVVMRENLGEVLSFVDFAKPYQPHRVEFHPVRHVSDLNVDNNTGWEFRASEQACEAFKDEYNEVMTQAKGKCEAEGISYEVLLL